MTALKVRYSGQEQEIVVQYVTTWKRDSLPSVVAGSSGPKAFLKNDVIALFDQDPSIDSVVMVVGRGTPFVLLKKGPHWFDVGGKQVEISKCTPGVQTKEERA